MKIVFLGTSQFGAIILDKLIKANYKPILAVTASDKPVGRKQTLTPPPVKAIAQQYEIPVIQPEKIQDTKYKIQNTKPDLIAVASYGQVLPKEILEIPKHGCLNVHPSLLPKYRGATPVQFAILKGDKKTGISIILMDEQIDHGPIIAQRKTTIGQNETAKELHDRLASLGAELLIDTIPDWINGKIQLQNQDEEKATYTKILTKEDGKINWNKTPEEIEKQIRALNPWPGTYTIYKSRRLKILEARIEKNKLVIEKVQLEGKKPMNLQDFLRGHPDFKI